MRGFKRMHSKAWRGWMTELLTREGVAAAFIMIMAQAKGSPAAEESYGGGVPEQGSIRTTATSRPGGAQDEAACEQARRMLCACDIST